MAQELVMMMTAVSGAEQGSAIAAALVEERLAACVQIVHVTSHYVWDGAARAEPEALLLIKTREALCEAVEARIKALHPYKLPEIVAVPLSFASADYAAWIEGGVRRA